MFGDGVRDEITSNIIRLPDYPRTLTLMMSTFIAIIPITKLPLNARPIISTIEVLTGLDERAVSNNPSMIGLSSQTRGLLRVTIRALVIVLLVILAVIFPAFDRIMAFMGSALCFSICIILPLVFYLKLFGDKIGKFEKLVDYIMIVVFSVLALTGTVFAFLPKELIGAE
jgi:vesicular inhibitory amino acid transporter